VSALGDDGENLAFRDCAADAHVHGLLNIAFNFSRASTSSRSGSCGLLDLAIRREFGRPSR
jgi:hypothetical protein